MGKFWRQFKALMIKNALYKKRNKNQIIQEIMFPVYFILVLAMIKGLMPFDVENPISSIPQYPLVNTMPVSALSGKILISPDTLHVRDIAESAGDVLMSILETSTPPKMEFYPDQDAMLEAYKSNASAVSAGIIIGYGKGDPDLTYAIRMPYDKIASTKNWLTDQSECREGNGLDNDSCSVNTYIHTGFSVLQLAFDTALARMKLNIRLFPAPQIFVQMMPKPKFTPNASYIQMMSAIYFVIAYSPFINFLTVNLVAEKEKKIKEGMKMMGLMDSAYWLSWGLIYTIIIIIVTVIITIIAYGFGFFANSDLTLFFLILFLYGLSVVALAFVLCPFFHQAKTAGALASLASMIFSLLYLVVSLTRSYTSTGEVISTISPAVRWIICLISPVALAMAIDQAIYLDFPMIGGMNYQSAAKGEFPLYAPMVMMCVDIVLYFFVAIYLDNTIPGIYGSKQKPFYFLEPSYWCSQTPTKDLGSDEKHLSESLGEDVEPVSSEIREKTAIRIKRLTKTFQGLEETVTAVNELSLEVYEGQITCLLGHNGAGKTTLMNMLTGLMLPTDGTATILGLDITSAGDMKKICSMTGVCPQHNILFDDLTCTEHLRVYAGIKGVTDDNIPQQIRTVLQQVDLYAEKDRSASKLSGGQKRKLSVAIALIGDPKVIFLDEPTAGMDPYSRRHLWSVLKQKKEGRVILLSTHFMDEADILADRKAFISKGKLRCCGSSLYLKSKFGIGYHLNMVVETDCNTEQVTEVVKECIEGAELQRIHGKELAYTLPINQVKHFPALFSSFEGAKQLSSATAESLGILSYGVSMTTLEEVFLKLEDYLDEEDDNSLDIKEIVQSHKKTSPDSKCSYKFIEDIPMETLKKDDEKKEEAEIENSREDNSVMQKIQVNSNVKWQQFWALCKINILRNMRDKVVLFLHLLLPVVFVVVGLLINKFASSGSDAADPKPFNITQGLAFYTGLQNYTTPAPPMLLKNSATLNFVSRHYEQRMKSVYKIDTYDNISDLLNMKNNHYMGIELLKFDTIGMLPYVDYVAVYNDSGIHSLPVVINLMSNSLLQTGAALLPMDIPSLLTTVSLPWPQLTNVFTYSQDSFSAVILLAMAFITVPAGFAVDLVKDRQFKVRSQLRVSGVSFWMYWGTNFLVDMIKFLIPAVLCVIIVFSLKLESLVHGGAMLSLLLLFLSYLPATTLFSYVFSFVFTRFETCQAMFTIIMFLSGFLPYIAVSVIDMVFNETTAAMLHFVFCCVFCPYSVFGGIYYIDRVFRVYGQTLAEGETIPFSAYMTPTVITSFSVPAIQILVWFIALRVLDVRATGGDIRDALFFGRNYKEEKSTEGNIGLVSDDEEDSDVAEERQRVSELQEKNKIKNTVAFTENLRKEFKKEEDMIEKCKSKDPEKVKVAVKNVTFGVEVGEIFGLLGPNGAGKTTTLNMMIAEVGPTKGRVMVGGHNIHSCMSDAFKALGYCPQHDALWDTITLREHLECYSAIRGISPNQIKKLVPLYIESLKMESHSSKMAKQMSGGTKRKLSYILSMLGKPRVVLMDEPSTGMDPQSKRFLWDTISQHIVGSDRGAILTTHYMEEADALCTRVAIMVNGKLQCLGATQHLKDKFGSGYLLEVKLRISEENESLIEQKMEILESYLKTLFPGVSCLEIFGERAQYKVPKDSVKSLAQTFKALEEAKIEYEMEEYSFSQSTLEQVFLEFAKQQVNDSIEDLEEKHSANEAETSGESSDDMFHTESEETDHESSSKVIRRGAKDKTSLLPKHISDRHGVGDQKIHTEKVQTSKRLSDSDHVDTDGIKVKFAGTKHEETASEEDLSDYDNIL